MGPIILSGYETATNADILQGTRLQTVPQGGVLTFELQALVNNAGNNNVVSIQMPNGDTPLNNVRVPGSNPSLDGVIDERQNLTVSFPIMQGGHCVFSTTESGTSILTWRVTYTPA
mgnify:CR=1 FL=1|jgi:hypothetical protein